MTQRKHRTLKIVATSLLIAFAAAPASMTTGIASAQSSSSAAAKLKELQAQRDKLRSQQSSAAANVNVLQAKDAELTKALSTLRSNVESEASLLEEAEQAATDADNRAAAANAAEAQAEQELAELNEDIKKQARDAFTQGSIQDDPLQLLTENSLSDASLKRTYRSARAVSGADTAENYRTIQANLLAARQEAETASAAAANHREQVSDRLSKLQTAQAEHEKLSAEVEARIERAAAEYAGLEESNLELSNQIKAQQTTLASALAKEREAAAARARAVGASAPRAPSSGGDRGPTVSSGDTTVVRGIRVHTSIASNVDSMIGAAANAGLSISGSGYRDPAAQIAVRKKNCGGDVYNKPASACSPPTARPGQSMHERGLAMDLNCNGSLIRSRSNPCFTWLASNAASFGFYNLPSEPWHWSTNGN